MPHVQSREAAPVSDSGLDPAAAMELLACVSAQGDLLHHVPDRPQSSNPPAPDSSCVQQQETEAELHTQCGQGR